jgi:hypothetical protein
MVCPRDLYGKMRNMRNCATTQLGYVEYPMKIGG